jgi:hypothetical protein
MNSELTTEFIKLFRQLPNRIQKTAKKNYQLWKQNPQHPSVEFKKLKTSSAVYSVRAGIGWRNERQQYNGLVLDRLSC